MRYCLGGLPGELLRIDADRKNRNAGSPEAGGDDATIGLNTEFRCQISEEIFAIILGLESDQIIRQHRLDQFAMMRDAFDDVMRGPRRMQEKPDRSGDTEFAQFRAKSQEMVILNPE